MRFFSVSFIILLAQSINLNAFEVAHEAERIKVEYYDLSKTGKVFVTNCSHCSQAIYDFSEPPIITINDKQIAFGQYLKSQKNKQLGTIVIDPKNNTVIRINF